MDDTTVSFGEKLVAPWMTLEELMESIHGDTIMHYNLLMPVLLFLPSFSTPADMLLCLIHSYRRLNTLGHSFAGTSAMMNILIILRCWLRESFAHNDFSDDMLLLLFDFLSDDVISCDYPALSAAGVKVQELVSRLQQEKSEADSCMRHYHKELIAVFSQTRKSVDLTPPQSSDPNSVHLPLPSSPSPSRRSLSRSPKPKVNHDVGNLEINTSNAGGADATPPRPRSASKPQSKANREPTTSPMGLTPSPQGKTRERRSNTDSSVIPYDPSRESIGPGLRAPSTDIFKEFGCKELAVVLTAIELEDGILTVRPREFVCKRWMDTSLKTVHPDLGGCLHLTRLIESSNQRIAWIADEIIHRGSLRGSLAEAIEYFLRVARYVLKLNNFNTLFQIISALNMPAIKHLSAAWSAVSTNKKHQFQAYTALCDPKKNYAIYRKRFQAASGRARIPCIQVLLRDIILMETSCAWLDKSKINMQKMESMFRLVNLNIFSTASPALDPHYEVKVTRGGLSARVLLHASDMTLQAQDDEVGRGFCSSCILLQESLFYHHRKSTTESSMLMHELSFGSYVRIASDLLSVYSAMELANSRHSFTFFASFFSSSDDINKYIHEPVDPAIFNMTVSDTAAISLMRSIQKTNTDLKRLWENSKVADEIENSRLMHRLMTAGLA